MNNPTEHMSQSKKETFVIDHWRQRRRMSYISIAWAIIQTFLWIGVEFLMPGTIGSMGAVIGWSYSLASVPIMGYFANTAIDTFKNPQVTPQPPKPGQRPREDGKPWETGI